MTFKTVFHTAVSLDGFLATADHNLDWLLSRHSDPDGPLGLNHFTANVGAIAMGASTYRWVIDHDKGPWPFTMPSWVFTHREFPEFTDNRDVRLTADPVDVVHKQMAEAAGGKDIWLMGGGELVGQFADHGLLDEIVVSIAPVTLGAGAPLLPRHLELKTEEVAHNGDFACVRYSVVR
ncbi:dihydrofolate reductase family protein [Nocardia huaxiensis]|uniref:Dihydrofolate reductase n=1 Tax=Nocardia huaxiensis TaxID=2755382 RepID=A0A7D6Z9E8_9NOCA|nr:dihydrofolate reductase family protein [Nocardia huaxiensis]QLY28258.1 dihydrofolate reductase [Nocardia huaxiensis]UFS98307.1 dihydrofolate reductase family protein [Nocardia huaxiensis]